MSRAGVPAAPTWAPRELTTVQVAAAFDLRGYRALVTGATHGVGRATATALAAAGATVLAGYRDEGDGGEAAHTLAQELKETGGDHRAVQADVAHPDGVAALVEACRAQLGTIEILVHGHTLDTTLIATTLVTQAAAPLLRANGGSVVTVGPMPGNPGLSTADAAAAAGLTGLTRSLARTLGPDRVRVNLVATGPAVANYPEHVAAVVLFLASAEAGGITGETFVVDGGQ